MPVLTAESVFDGRSWNNVGIRTENGSIKEIGDPASFDKDEHIHYPGCLIVPAFIDLQIYGAHGKLLAVYPEASSLQLLYDYCTKGGAANFLPTVATNQRDVIYKCIDAVKAYWKEGGKGVPGLHLEGPWINPAKKGAHVTECIHAPELKEVEELLAYGNGVIRMITLAPEVCPQEVIDLILSKDIIISAGHSDANFSEAYTSFDRGISTVTHLYNAMSPLHHRAPGFVGACFLHDRVRASIIADGYHVDYEAIRIAKAIMKERLFAITDAVTETNEGFYHHSFSNDKYECNGVLSGSALTMHKAFLNLVNKAGIEVGEAIRMCSLYPAEVLKCDHVYGKIAPGCEAQFLVLDQQLNMIGLVSG